MNKKRFIQSGMTIIEITVVLVILSITMTAIFSMLSLNSTVFSRESAEAEVRKKGREILQNMLREIQTARWVGVEFNIDEDNKKVWLLTLIKTFPLDINGDDDYDELNETAGVQNKYKLEETATGTDIYSLSINGTIIRDIHVKKNNSNPFFKYENETKTVIVDMILEDIKTSRHFEFATSGTPRIGRGYLLEFDVPNINFNTAFTSYSTTAALGQSWNIDIIKTENPFDSIEFTFKDPSNNILQQRNVTGIVNDLSSLTFGEPGEYIIEVKVTSIEYNDDESLESPEEVSNVRTYSVLVYVE